MLKRKIYEDMLRWKNKNNKKCLLIKGARQVGKTYIIDKFCRENYKNYVYINFYEHEEYNSIFDGNYDVDYITEQITINIPTAKLVSNETVIFLDEIQECPRAIAALKFLNIDGKYDIIASGSLLGISYKNIPSYPVGYVEHLEMNSLDFEEFCWANGMSEEALGLLKKYFVEKKKIPDSIHNKMMELFKKYIVIGGMPAVVQDFTINHDYNEVLKIQKDIVEDYRLDIAKYAKETEKAKIRECFDSIPKHLAQDNKKFRYGLVSNGGKAEKYQSSLQWLFDAGIINFCYNLSIPEMPLEGNAKSDIFKVYMKDTGLLMSMLEDGVQKEVINGNLGVYKGAIYENIIGEIFAKSGKKLYYFDYNSTLEIDFFIRYEDVITAVEVKSGDNTKSKSLNSVMTNWGVKKGIRLSSKNIGEFNSTDVMFIPLYMSMFL